jgi:hypothetical protein
VEIDAEKSVPISHIPGDHRFNQAGFAGAALPKNDNVLSSSLVGKNVMFRGNLSIDYQQPQSDAGTPAWCSVDHFVPEIDSK